MSCWALGDEVFLVLFRGQRSFSGFGVLGFKSIGSDESIWACVSHLLFSKFEPFIDLAFQNENRPQIQTTPSVTIRANRPLGSYHELDLGQQPPALPLP